jgi:acetyl-CoA synthetase
MSNLANQGKQWSTLNYTTYREAMEKFRWSERWSLFNGSKKNFNIAYECIERHPKDNIALRIKYENRNTEIYSFGDLSLLTSKFANLLERMGINKGDRVAVLLQPCLEFYITMFGVYKRGAVLVPCFPLFGPEAIAFRLDNAGVSVIVTNRDKQHLVDPELAAKLNLKFIYAEELREMLMAESGSYTPATSSGDQCMIQYSSGTTGTPKAVRYVHGAITVAAVVMKFAVGLRADDTYFCFSSPAWGHGIWYGTIAPLIFGKAVGTYSGKFDAEICLEALQEFGVTNMTSISSHYRLIMETGKADKYNLKLRMISFSGEAMSKEVIRQIKDQWGLVPYTQYGTTEVGPITLDYGGFTDWVVKPGSLGKPMLGGLKVGIVDEEGQALPPGKIGQIALWQKDKWEVIGDNAYVDDDGYFWYIGRADDVIISAGYTIGPIEVEQSIIRHEAVEECAVIGAPDSSRGEIIKAFIKLKPGYTPSETLKEGIQAFVRDKLSKHEYPRAVEFIDELPKTPDGKIKRKVLRELERQKIG